MVKPGTSFLLNHTYSIIQIILFFYISIAVSRCKPAKCKLPYVRLVFVTFKVLNKRMKFGKKSLYSLNPMVDAMS